MKKAMMRPGEGLGKKYHDALLKSVFSIPVHAQSLLRDQLPKEIVKLLADNPPKIVGDSFVNENLRQSQADLLMEVEMASGEPSLVYVLVEHKSYSDGEAALQMLSYMVRIWQRHVDGREDGKGKEGRAARARTLPPIIPLLAYSGTRPWTGPTNFADMFATDDPNLIFLRGPDLIVREWAQMSPEKLSRDPIPRAGLLTLTGRGLANFDEIDEALLDNPVLQDQFVEYIRNTSTGETREELERKLAAAKPEQKEGVLGRMMEKLKAEGRVEGEAKGRVEGEAKSLTRLLERRFGPLPAAIKSRVDRADLKQLDAWIDRVRDVNLDSPYFLQLQSVGDRRLPWPEGKAFAVLPRRIRIPFQPKAKSTLRTKITAQSGLKIQTHYLQYVDMV